MPQISIRLEEEDLRILKRKADELALGYTTPAGSLVSRAVRRPSGTCSYVLEDQGGRPDDEERR